MSVLFSHCSSSRFLTRVYGCSSRFTDSKKYELDFIECFQLTTPRKGEICNACVLLVKRFKRLPPGSDRHWGHVVDARVGPGLKSMTKFKKRKDDIKENNKDNVPTKSIGNASTQNKPEKSGISCVPERFCKIFKKTKKKPNGATNGSGTSIKLKKHHKKDMDSSGSDGESSPNSPMSSISDGDSSNGVPDTDNLKISTKYKRKNYHPFKNKRRIEEFHLLDTQNWKKKMTCCGLIYENPMISAVIIDISLHEPCKEHLLARRRSSNVKKVEGVVGDLEHELNGSCNTDDLLIKLTDEQIQENIASHSGFNKISKVSELFNTNTTAFKKHHLYSKRGNVLIPTNGSNTDESHNKKSNSAAGSKTETIKNMNSNGTSVVLQAMPRMNEMDVANGKDSLHKVKAENGGKIIKPTNVDKLSALKLKSLDFNVKNLVKLCTEKSIRPAEMGNGGVENGNKTVGGKFMSDNSSDSGYEEAQEAQVRFGNSRHVFKYFNSLLIP